MGRQLPKKTQLNYLDDFSDEDLAHYQVNPIDFIHDIIFHEDSVRNGGHLYLSDQQEQVFRALGDHSITRTSVVSGKGIGKTALISLGTLWFIACFPNPKMAATAPSFPQLKSAYWTEVGKWLQRSLIKPYFVHTAEKLYLDHADYAKTWWCEPRTATKPENMQGLHEDFMFLIIDEGSGVADDVFEVLDTTMTATGDGINKLITIGNGTQTSGFFFDSHHDDAKRWKTFQFSSIDSPYVDKESTAALIEKYGWEHDVVRVSIRGLFPKGSPDALISLERVSMAMQRDVLPKKTDEIQIGCDPARFGDDLCAFAWRWGNKVFPLVTYPKTGGDEVVEHLFELVRDIRKKTGSTAKIKVCVDVGGIGGPIIDFMRKDRDHNVEIVECNFGGEGDDDYGDEASIMWGKLEEVIDHISLPENRFLSAEVSTRRFKIPKMRIKIESKQSYKDRYKSSPDLADAVVLCLSDKEEETTVLNNFDRYNSRIVKEDISYITSGEKIISIFYSKTQHVSIVVSIWDRYRINIIDNYSGDNNLYAVGKFLGAHSSGKGQRQSTIIGNSYMFGTTRGDDVASQLRKQGFRVQPNNRYDEGGAIQTYMQMLADERITVYVGCDELLEQMQTWIATESRAVLETSYGLCYASINIASKLASPTRASWTPPVSTQYKNENDNVRSSAFVNPMLRW
jgi:phage terminase large subunit